ncbi:MAG: hypothetical protein OEZ06_03185 [Myxococcales bacterium]|nr:hypothetical protein [Myxococcales bacterium]
MTTTAHPHGPRPRQRAAFFVATVLAAIALGSACGSDDGGQTTADPQSAATAGTGAEQSGQTGSAGAAECQSDAECLMQAEALVDAGGGVVRLARCAEVSCEIIVERDEGCVTRSGTVHDCALSDSQILDADAKSSAVVSCDEAQASSGAVGTCVETSVTPTEYYPRDSAEWQGMLVEKLDAPCEDFCGMALSCRQMICQPCTRDEDCLQGEGCALDHCLLLDRLHCRSYTDCGAGELCILSGYTGGTARANEDMCAYCNGGGGGPATTPCQ